MKIKTSEHLVPLALLGIGIVVAVLVVLSTGDDAQAPQPVDFVVNLESETQLVRTSAEAGGPPLAAQPALRGMHSYPFVCQIELPDGTAWYKLAEDRAAYVNSEMLRRPNGFESATPPACG